MTFEKNYEPNQMHYLGHERSPWTTRFARRKGAYKLRKANSLCIMNRELLATMAHKGLWDNLVFLEDKDFRLEPAG